MARELNKLNRKYPGVWVPGTKQKVSEVMSNVQRALAKEYDYALKAKSPQMGGRPPVPSRRDPGLQEFRPSDKELFPSTSVPEVPLKDKEEFKL